VKAELKRIHSPDVYTLENFEPNEADKFGILLQLMVGPVNTEGEESFDLMVCTPKWLSDNYGKTDIVFGRHYLIVFEYDYDAIYSKLKSIIESIDADNWEDLGLLIGRIAKWEFEDYQN